MSSNHGMAQDAGDDEISLAEVWGTIRRNRWLIGASFALTTGLAVAYALRARPVYEASASIRIDEKQSNLPVLDVLKSLSQGNQVSTEMQVLKSRTLAEDVVDSLALQVSLLEPRRAARGELFAYVHADSTASKAVYSFERRRANAFLVRNATTGASVGVFAPGQRITLEGVTLALLPAANEQPRIRIAVEPRAEAVLALGQVLKVARPDREANLVVVGYRATDQRLVRDVPNLLARRFITRRHDIQQTEARSTVRFLREQIDTLNSQLAASENALKAFREGEQVVSLDDEARAQVGRLADLQAQRSTLDAERSALAHLLEEVQASAAQAQQPGAPSPYRRLIAFPTLLRNPAASALLTSLANVEDQRAALLGRRTPQDPDVQVLTARVGELEEQLRSIATTYLDGLTNQVAAIDVTLNQFGAQLAKVPAKEIQVARLERRPKILQDIYVLLQTRLKEAEIAEAVEDPSVRMVDPAVLPDEPIGGKKKLIVLLGALFGLAGGVAVAFLREHMDRTVHTREDIQDATGLSVLGLIPRIQQVAARSSSGSGAMVRLRGARGGQMIAPPAEHGLSERLVTGVSPRNPVSEAYRALRTSITFARPDQPVRTLVFTSPMPGDGKSTTSANLAITLAQQGLRVLLVDADMRRGLLNQVFNTDREPGLSNVLLGGVPVEVAVRKIDLGESGTLHFLPTGTLPPNPAELLGSARMRALLDQLEKDFEMIILDAPPVNLVTDAAILGTNADGVVVVVRAAVTNTDALGYAMELMRNVRVTPLGVVLNDVDFKRDMRYYSSYGGYAYYQYYGVEEHAR